MFASVDDLKRAWGPDAVTRLSTALAQADVTPAQVLERALDHASVLIEAHLGRRYVLPLAAPNPVLTALAADLAIGRLATTADLATDDIRRREDQALRDLKAIAGGTMDLGLAQPDGASAQPVLSSRLEPGREKLFSRDRLSGF